MNAIVDRTKFIGGSDIAAVLGIDPWRTPVDLYLDKVLPQHLPQTPPQRRGSLLERYIVDEIDTVYGMKATTRNQRYTDRLVPFFACEVDCEFADESNGIENGEIKTVHPFKRGAWGEEETDELPTHYVAQAQWNLGITDRKLCHVFALFGDELQRYRVVRDDEIITAMRDRASAFWSTYVQRMVPPPIEWTSPHALATLKRLYPGTDGETMTATPSHTYWRKVMEEAAELRDRYDRTVDAARAHLLDEMGDAALLQFTDGKAFRRKRIEVKGYTVEPRTQIDFRLITMKDKA